MPLKKEDELNMPLHCSINENEFDLFKGYIKEKSGIVIPKEKAYLIETRLSKLMLDAGTESFSEFYRYIAANIDPVMPQKIINAITTNETMWFRDEAPWKVLEEFILPGLVEKLAAGQKSKVRIWSAAVSTGQEAYSSVMCVDDYLGKSRAKGVGLSDFDFFATDISSRVLELAKHGRYDKISIMRGLSDYYRKKYFESDGSVWNLEPKIKDAVRFKQFNLLESFSEFGIFDIIFCRNVLIYFAEELKKEIISKIRDSLADGGVLFIGNYVLVDLFNEGFNANYYGNMTYYTKKMVAKL